MSAEPPDFRAPIDPGAPPTEADLRAVRTAAFELGRLQGRDGERRRVEGLALYHLDHTQPGPRALLSAIRAGKAAP